MRSNFMFIFELELLFAKWFQGQVLYYSNPAIFQANHFPRIALAISCFKALFQYLSTLLRNRKFYLCPKFFHRHQCHDISSTQPFPHATFYFYSKFCRGEFRKQSLQSYFSIFKYYNFIPFANFLCSTAFKHIHVASFNFPRPCHEIFDISFCAFCCSMATRYS